MVSEFSLQRSLWYNYYKHRYRVLNTYYFKEESDFLTFLSSGYCWEFEIKISKSDFKNDFKKRKHKGMSNVTTQREAGLPNRFYFATPPDLIVLGDIPDYAGLIYVDKFNCTIIKTAPLLHKKKHDPKRLFTKFYHYYESSIREKFKKQ